MISKFLTGTTLRGFIMCMSIPPNRSPQSLVSGKSASFGPSRFSKWIPSLLASGLIITFGTESARAAACFWTDQVGDHLWSTSGNWFDNVAPVSGDTVVFGERDKDNGTTSGFTIDDIPNLELVKLIFGNENVDFTIESTAGPITIQEELLMEDVSSELGESQVNFQCPVV